MNKAKIKQLITKYPGINLSNVGLLNEDTDIDEFAKNQIDFDLQALKLSDPIAYKKAYFFQKYSQDQIDYLARYRQQKGNTFMRISYVQYIIMWFLTPVFISFKIIQDVTRLITRLVKR